MLRAGCLAPLCRSGAWWPRLRSPGELGKSSPGREENRVAVLTVVIPLGAGDSVPVAGVCRVEFALYMLLEGLLHSGVCGSLILPTSAACRQQGCGGRKCLPVQWLWPWLCGDLGRVLRDGGTSALLQGSSPQPSNASHNTGIFFNLCQPDNRDVAPSLCPPDLVKRIGRAQG